MMNNGEISKKALTKVKVKNLTFMVVCAFAGISLSGLSWRATGNPAADVCIMTAIFFAISFITCGGLTRVSITAWRQNEAHWGEYVRYFRDPKPALRTAPAGLLAAVSYFAPLMMLMTDNPCLLLAASAIGIVLNLMAQWMFYGMELVSSPADGLRMFFANFKRAIAMEISLYWWIYLIRISAYALAAMAAGLTGIGVAVVMFLVNITIEWAIGSFIALAKAGLARELFKQY